jgi:hypothetical protein
VTEAAQEFMRRFPKRSLGIVAINKPQQELIQKMLDELFATDVEAESYRLRWEHTLESVFVKNLENVQGDERDVIFISTVYGRDASGNFFQRLGPINGAHGHRRLNVLFTRAKQQVCLFTSMRANDLRVEESSRWGVKALKNYLTYAESGQLDTGEPSGREPESEFERLGYGDAAGIRLRNGPAARRGWLLHRPRRSPPRTTRSLHLRNRMRWSYVPFRTFCAGPGSPPTRSAGAIEMEDLPDLVDGLVPQPEGGIPKTDGDSRNAPA